MALIKLMLGLLIFCVSIGAIVSIGTFLVDVIKWHDREEKVVIVPSAQDPEQEIEVKEVEDSGSDGEYNSSTVPFPWSES